MAHFLMLIGRLLKVAYKCGIKPFVENNSDAIP